MRVLMTVDTGIHLRGCAMETGFMALIALGHDLSVIILQRVIGVKLFMAIRTGDILMFISILFQSGEMRKMTLSTLGDSEWFNIKVVDIGFRC